jgi:hypothetical protein
VILVSGACDNIKLLSEKKFTNVYKSLIKVIKKNWSVDIPQKEKKINLLSCCLLLWRISILLNEQGDRVSCRPIAYCRCTRTVWKTRSHLARSANSAGGLAYPSTGVVALPHFRVMNLLE